MWAVVGVVAALAIAAAALMLLLRRRRARKRLQQQLMDVKIQDPAELPSENSQSTTKLGSEGMGSGKLGSALPSPGNSGFLEPHASKSSVPDGAWRSRWVSGWLGWRLAAARAFLGGWLAEAPS